MKKKTVKIVVFILVALMVVSAIAPAILAII